MKSTWRQVAMGCAAGVMVSLTFVPSAHAATTVVTTANLNVREGPSTSTRILSVLPQGTSVPATGPSSNGWTPISWQGQQAYVFSQYVQERQSSAPAPQAPAPAPQTGASGTAQTTAYLNMRSGPGLGNAVLGVLSPGTQVALTGQKSDGWSQISFRGEKRWVSAMYLTGFAGGSAPAPTPQAPPAPPPPPVVNPQPPTNTLKAIGTRWTTVPLNVRPQPGYGAAPITYIPTGGAVQITGVTSGEWTQIVYLNASRWVFTAYLTDRAPNPNTQGGSVGLDRITATTRQALNNVRAAFPECATIYGYRPGDPGEHGSGRALDFMIAQYKSNSALGDRIVAYLQANASRLDIYYIIWQQKIWLAEYPERGWQLMNDRGSDTQNHYDHVHLSLNS